MESKIAERARTELAAAMLRLNPTQRAEAFLHLNECIAALALAGRHERESGGGRPRDTAAS